MLPIDAGIVYCNALIARGDWKGCKSADDGRGCGVCQAQPDCLAHAEYRALNDACNKARDAVRAECRA
jgi:hypothetical protein